MNDLISRQAAQAIKVLPKCYREYKTGNLDDAYDEGWEDAMLSLNALPTIDPVKHGKWNKLIYRDDSKGFGCSVCGGVSLIPTNYCGNCGASMKRSEDETH